MTTLPRPNPSVDRQNPAEAAPPSTLPRPEAEQDDEEVLQPGPSAVRHPVALSFTDRIEAFIARLSTRNHFWPRVCSMIWLPYAFRSGIRMKRVGERSFSAELPFRRFNRNWYNAMAGAALLANSEIAGGMYIFGIAGGDYTVVGDRRR